MLKIVILKNVGLVERFAEVMLRWVVEFQFQNGILPEQILSDWSVRNNMRWVTYYEDIMMDGKVADIDIHKDKESATRFFKAHYRDYFQLNPKHIEVKLPMRYGFPFRAFYGVSLLTFKRRMMERFKIDEKEFNRQLKELGRKK